MSSNKILKFTKSGTFVLTEYQPLTAKKIVKGLTIYRKCFRLIIIVLYYISVKLLYYFIFLFFFPFRYGVVAEHKC